MRKEQVKVRMKTEHKATEHLFKNMQYAPKFHLMPPVGWLNDPNGLCQVKGLHHIFFQYSPDEVNGGLKRWGHYETRDFLHYQFTGIFLEPDCRADQNGVYSGSAYVEKDTMYLYYTGNVKLEGKDGEYDYIYSGREGNTVLVESQDGITHSPKEWLLTVSDYPENMSNHIRDPKVFAKDGTYYMVLGGRTRDDEGCVLLYTSPDKRNWTFQHLIQKPDFGYMWECPDLFWMGEEFYLSMSPQGLTSEEYRFQNVYQSGYFHTTQDLTKVSGELDEFWEWDYGFDFYAPQTYEDESGRRILIGWMGMPDAEYFDRSVEEGWQHMLTLPREICVDAETKRLMQMPIEEIKTLRKACLYSGKFTQETGAIQAEDVYEADLEGFAERDFEIQLDTDFVISYKKEERECCFYFTDQEISCGRTQRKIKLLENETIQCMKIFADRSCLEIYINNGMYVFTTKRFPKDQTKRELRICGTVEEAVVYSMGSYSYQNKKGK